MTDPRATDETRIDRWLCAVRLVKTRPLATRLCEARIGPTADVTVLLAEIEAGRPLWG